MLQSHLASRGLEPTVLKVVWSPRHKKGHNTFTSPASSPVSNLANLPQLLSNLVGGCEQGHQLLNEARLGI